MKAREWTLAALLALLMLYAWRADPSFVSLRAQALLSTHIWELAIVAIPMLLIVIAAGIDLSVGSMFALCAVVLGLLHERGVPIGWAAIAAMAAGALQGAINGWFVARLKVHPLLVTLGTMAAYRGIAEGISTARPLSGYPEGFLALSHENLLGVPIPGWVFLCLAMFAALVLGRTVFGKWTIALGTNESATRFSAIPVARVQWLLFAGCGLACGIAAVLTVARTNTAKADMGMGLPLEAVTAVVLGGAKIEGGSGSVIGLVLGLALIHETREFVSWHWKLNELNLIVLGALLIVSVLIQRVFESRNRVASRPA
ncbi:MAG TPA: ABC transporter permease [Fimbriimonadaceae bacterium]|nr:ABC transporter permease [Fimbriimonadaceae bacterium]